MACPICKKELTAEAKNRPFCSRRCQLIDLGNWLGEKYAVPGEEAPDQATQSEAASGEAKQPPTLH